MMWLRTILVVAAWLVVALSFLVTAQAQYLEAGSGRDAIVVAQAQPSGSEGPEPMTPPEWDKQYEAFQSFYPEQHKYIEQKLHGLKLKDTIGSYVVEKGFPKDWYAEEDKWRELCGLLATKGVGDDEFQAQFGGGCQTLFSRGISTNAALNKWCGPTGKTQCENPPNCDYGSDRECKSSYCCCGNTNAPGCQEAKDVLDP